MGCPYDLSATEAAEKPICDVFMKPDLDVTKRFVYGLNPDSDTRIDLKAVFDRTAVGWAGGVKLSSINIHFSLR